MSVPPNCQRSFAARRLAVAQTTRQIYQISESRQWGREKNFRKFFKNLYLGEKLEQSDKRGAVIKRLALPRGSDVRLSAAVKK